MKKAKIDNLILRLHSRAEIDISVLKDELSLFLSDEYKDVTNYMNNAFLSPESEFLKFIKSSINQSTK